MVATTTGWRERLPLAPSHPSVLFQIEMLLQAVSDTAMYHQINVWRCTERAVVPVVTIEEQDPWSGIAHRYSWSQDSKALLITGGGRLLEDASAGDLCLVYLPATDELYRLRRCHWRTDRAAFDQGVESAPVAPWRGPRGSTRRQPCQGLNFEVL